jgi:hypothetical protein
MHTQDPIKPMSNERIARESNGVGGGKHAKQKSQPAHRSGFIIVTSKPYSIDKTIDETQVEPSIDGTL